MDFDSSKVPDFMKAGMKQRMLDHLKFNGIEPDELSLFEWYVKETETIAQQMLASETAYVQEQYDSGFDNVNDSGLLPVTYFIRRSRYSHVIYLASLGETYMTSAIHRLTAALGNNIIFTFHELSGAAWSKERKFLQRYGNFEIPERIWSRYKTIYDVRNHLVHENGVISLVDEQEREKLKRKYKDIPGLIFQNSEVVIEPSFIADSLAGLREFIEFVDEQIELIVERTAKFCVSVE